MPTVRQLITQWLVKTDTSQLEKLDGQLKSMRADFMKLGATAAGALAALIAPAASLQSQIKNSMTIVNAQGPAFRQMEKDMTEAALRLSDRLGVSAADIANGFYQTISTGAEPLSEGFLNLTETGVKLAETVGMGIGDSIESLNDTVNAFKLNADDFERVGDVLFSASNMAATTVPQLVEAMKNAAPAAASMGISIEETASVLSSLSNVGIKGSEAGMAVRQILVRLTNSAGPGAEALRAIGISAFDAQGKMRPLIDVFSDLQVKMSGMTEQRKAEVLADVAGQEVYAKLAALMNSDLETVRRWTDALKESEGALDKAFRVKAQGAAFAIGELWDRMKNLLATIGEPLLEPLTKFVRMISDGIVKVREWAVANEGLVSRLAKLGGLIGVVVLLASVLGVAAVSFQLLGNAALIAQVKMFLWAIAVAALIALFALLAQDFYKFFTGAQSLIGDVVEWFGSLNRDAKLFLAVVGAIAALALVFFAPWVAGFLLLSMGVGYVIAKWDELKWKVEDVIAGIKTALNDLGYTLSNSSVGKFFGIKAHEFDVMSGEPYRAPESIGWSSVPLGGMSVMSGDTIVNVNVSSGAGADEIASEISAALKVENDRRMRELKQDLNVRGQRSMR